MYSHFSFYLVALFFELQRVNKFFLILSNDLHFLADLCRPLLRLRRKKCSGSMITRDLGTTVPFTWIKWVANMLLQYWIILNAAHHVVVAWQLHNPSKKYPNFNYSGLVASTYTSTDINATGGRVPHLRDPCCCLTLWPTLWTVSSRKVYYQLHIPHGRGAHRALMTVRWHW